LAAGRWRVWAEEQKLNYKIWSTYILMNVPYSPRGVPGNRYPYRDYSSKSQVPPQYEMLTTIINYNRYRLNHQVTMDCLGIAVSLVTEISPDRGNALAVCINVHISEVCSAALHRLPVKGFFFAI
jgi:hypothetical protein